MSQHVRDNTAIERRLRPIYGTNSPNFLAKNINKTQTHQSLYWIVPDSLEVGNNKKALQDAEKVLKKTPNLTCARALKGLSLLRLGREPECHAVFNQLWEQPVTDPSTLQVASCYYRETDQRKFCGANYKSANLIKMQF